MNRSFTSLEKRGLVTNGNKLTVAGQQIIDEQKLQTIKLVKPKKWDGRWRVVIFDIPEELRPARNRFRRKLKELNFEIVQKSVFRSKLPCVLEIRTAAELLGISKFVQIITGDFV